MIKPSDCLRLDDWVSVTRGNQDIFVDYVNISLRISKTTWGKAIL